MRKQLNMNRHHWKLFYRAVRSGRVSNVEAIRAHGVHATRGHVHRVMTWNAAKHLLDILLHKRAEMTKAERREFIRVCRTMGAN